MTRNRASEIVSQVLNFSKSDEMFIALTATEGSTVQFAHNRIMRSFASSGATIQVTVRSGGQYGMASGTKLDEDGLRAIVQSAEQQIGRLPVRENILPFPGDTSVVEAPLKVESAAHEMWMHERVSAAIERTKSSGLFATGLLSLPMNTTVVASSNGLFLYQQMTPAHFLLRVLDANGTSTAFNEQYQYDASKLEVAALTQTAIDKCLAWKNPKSIDQTRITTVFEAQPFAEMLLPFLRQFDYSAYKDKRSFLAKLDGSSRQGEKLFEDWVTIASDPYDSRIPSMPFSADGLAIRPASWIKDGVVHDIMLSRFDAKEAQQEAVPMPSNYIMKGGEDTLEQLIATTEYGLLVSGFAALEVEDPNNCLVSGSTRDGLFLIEDGKITSAVENLMIRETPMYVIRRMEALGNAQRVTPKGAFLPMSIPSIRATDVMYARKSGII